MKTQILKSPAERRGQCTRMVVGWFSVDFCFVVTAHEMPNAV